jgi:hypothetical protein
VCVCPFPPPPLLHCLLPLRRLLLLAVYRQPAAPARISRSWVECASLKDRPLAPALLFVCGLFPLYERSLSLSLSRAGQGTLQYSILLPSAVAVAVAAATAHRPPLPLCLEGVCQLASVPCTCCLPPAVAVHAVDKASPSSSSSARLVCSSLCV